MFGVWALECGAEGRGFFNVRDCDCNTEKEYQKSTKKSRQNVETPRLRVVACARSVDFHTLFLIDISDLSKSQSPCIQPKEWHHCFAAHM